MTDDRNQRGDNAPASESSVGDGAAPSPSGFVPPHPGSRKMPRWNSGELIDAPKFVRKHWYATISYNFALGISCCHTLVLNTVLLPRELRPGWFVRIAMALGGIFFFLLGLAATLRELGQI